MTKVLETQAESRSGKVLNQDCLGDGQTTAKQCLSTDYRLRLRPPREGEGPDPVMFKKAMEDIAKKRLVSIGNKVFTYGPLTPPLFFAFNSSVVTAENKAIIEGWVKDELREALTVEKIGGTMFLLQGYASREGTVEYNQTLALTRAQSVKRTFEELGVREGLFWTSSLGETRPLDTAGREAEPADRRVVVSRMVRFALPPVHLENIPVKARLSTSFAIMGLGGGSAAVGAGLEYQDYIIYDPTNHRAALFRYMAATVGVGIPVGEVSQYLKKIFSGPLGISSGDDWIPFQVSKPMPVDGFADFAFHMEVTLALEYGLGLETLRLFGPASWGGESVPINFSVVKTADFGADASIPLVTGFMHLQGIIDDIYEKEALSEDSFKDVSPEDGH